VPLSKSFPAGFFLLTLTFQFGVAQTVTNKRVDQTAADTILLKRQYREKEELTYFMRGVNEAWRYEVRATGLVKRDSNGTYVEDYAWSNLTSNGVEIPLPPASANFRQQLSLDPQHPPTLPPLSQVSPMLIGPITDLLTFYSDLWLAIRAGSLVHTGDHFYRRYGTPASWADGRRVLLGQDSFDFDVTLADVNRSAQTATVAVRHVDPEQPEVKLPADWMHAPVADSPNNWVQVVKTDEIKVSLVDGKILHAALDNLVVAHKRQCEDAALAICDDPVDHQIRRHIQLNLEH
jgi:hypothetical protein